MAKRPFGWTAEDWSKLSKAEKDKVRRVENNRMAERARMDAIQGTDFRRRPEDWDYLSKAERNDWYHRRAAAKDARRLLAAERTLSSEHEYKPMSRIEAGNRVSGPRDPKTENLDRLATKWLMENDPLVKRRR